MKRKLLSLGTAIGFFAAALLPLSVSAATTTVYDATPSPLPPNVASLGFQATSTSEFGDRIVLGGADRELQDVTVTMSNWALYSTYENDERYSASSETWTHDITLNIYDDELDANGVPTTLLASSTEEVTIPWRPEADPTCAGGTAWRADDSLCYNGIAFNTTFDMSGLGVTLPDEVIVSVAYDTQTYGANPIGVTGPYNSLNVGVPSNQAVTIGTDENTDAVFWDTSHAPFYADGGAGGVGVLREDANWTPNGTVAFKINAAAPLVGPATNKDDCKHGGWESFNNPTYKNQGDCVSAVASKGKAKGNPTVANSPTF